MDCAITRKIGYDKITGENPPLHLFTSGEFGEFYDLLVKTPDKERVFKAWYGDHARFLEDRHWALTVFHPGQITSRIIEDSSIVVAPEVRASFCPGSIVHDGFKLRTDPHALYGCA